MKSLFIKSAKLSILATLLFVPMFLHAEKKAWVEYQNNTRTMTFRYDDQKDNVTATVKYDISDDIEKGQDWTYDDAIDSVEHVVFDQSFADALPKSCVDWFHYMYYITSIEGIEYLNTSEVRSMKRMFDECRSLKSIDLSHFDTSNVEDMSRMFADCTALTSLDFSTFNTAKVNTMKQMFTGCAALSDVIFPSTFTTSSVTDMSKMFLNCASLKSIDLTTFYTSAVTDASNMFFGCSSLATLYVGDNFTFQNTWNGENMFYGCTKFPEYNGYYVGKSYADRYVTKIVSNAEPWVEYSLSSKTLTFHYDDQNRGDANCFKISNSSSNVPGWLTNRDNVEKVVFDKTFSYARPTCCYCWFSGMKKLTTIEGIEYLNTSCVTDMMSMFNDCTSLTTLDLRHFNTQNVASAYGMFYGCTSLTNIYANKSFVLSDACNGNLMFANCTSLTGYNINNVGKEMANYATGYFSKYTATIEPWAAYDENAHTLTFYYNGEKDYFDATAIFDYNLLTTTNTDGNFFVTPKWVSCKDGITKAVFDKSFADYCPTSCMAMFTELSNLTTIEGIENLNTSKVITMSYMFANTGLTSIDLSHFDTSSTQIMMSMFYGMSDIKNLDLSQFDTSKVTQMAYMFARCKNLKSIDLSSFNTSSLEENDMLFYNCPSLQNIYVNADFSLKSSYDIFDGCDKLPNYNSEYTGIEKANYTNGYLTLRRHFSVGDATYNADGTDAICYDDVAFDDKDAFTSEFDFTFASKNNATYKRAISNNWATLCLPFSFDTSAYEDMHCYKISEIGSDKITVEKIDGTVAAGEPILVYTTIGKIYITGNDGSKVVKAPVASDYLTGTFAEADVANDAKNYIISKDKFWNVSSLISQSSATSVKMSPYRAYIAGQSSSAKAVSLDIMMDETDGINDINTNDALQSLDGAEFYDAQGHRLSSPERGLVIIKKGGITRKMIVK